MATGKGKNRLTVVEQDEPKARVSSAEKARILRENGIDVYQWFEHKESKFRPLPTIFFAGDDEAGPKAVKVMQKHGFPVGRLSREWIYNGRMDFDEIKWALIV